MDQHPQHGLRARILSLAFCVLRRLCPLVASSSFSIFLRPVDSVCNSEQHKLHSFNLSPGGAMHISLQEQHSQKRNAGRTGEMIFRPVNAMPCPQPLPEMAISRRTRRCRGTKRAACATGCLFARPGQADRMEQIYMMSGGEATFLGTGAALIAR